MINSPNSEFNWNHVITWKNILNQLGKKELIDLSTVSRYLRHKINPIIFKILNLEKYRPSNEGISKFGVKLSNKSIVDLQVQNLKDELQPISQFIQEFSVGKDFNHSLVLSIPKLLPSLKHFKLSGVRIPLESLNQLLEEFVELESLSLWNTSVIQWQEPMTSTIQLKFPKSLKSLLIDNFQQLQLPFDNDAISVNFNSYTEHVNPTSFHIPSQHLPNLEILRFLDTDESCISNVNQLLDSQSQLKTFQIGVPLLNQQCFDDLERCHQLNNLKLFYKNVNPSKFDELTFPRFESVRVLECILAQIPDYDLVERLFMTCPNVERLAICYLTEFGSKFNRIFSRLTLLEHLTINNWDDPNTFFETELPSNALKSIELSGFDPLVADLDKFQNCHELKHVVIELYGDYLERKAYYTLYFTRFLEWRCFVLSESIECYRA